MNYALPEDGDKRSSETLIVSYQTPLLPQPYSSQWKPQISQNKHAVSETNKLQGQWDAQKNAKEQYL
jgi:hypothetical protein